jgi:hypothetical protein
VKEQKPTRAYRVAAIVFLILGLGGTAWGLAAIVRVTSELSAYYANPCTEARWDDCVHKEDAEVTAKITETNEVSLAYYLVLKANNGRTSKLNATQAIYNQAKQGETTRVYVWRGDIVALDKPGYSADHPPRNEQLVGQSMGAFVVSLLGSLFLVDGLAALYARRKKPTHALALTQVLFPIIGGGVAAIICSVVFMDTPALMFAPFLVTYLWGLWRLRAIRA